jgi:hypothetical protein
MRQAVTTIITAITLAFSLAAHASHEQSGAPATIAQAKRLIEAKDYAPAANFLEDLLAEADATDNPAILELLRQSYQAMAREAKAAGRDREAAYFLDNLAIITKVPSKAAPAKPGEDKPRAPAASQPLTPGSKAADPAGKRQAPSSARNVALVGSAQELAPAPPPEPAPVSAPAQMPASQPLPLLPREIAAHAPDPADPSPAGDQGTPPHSSGESAQGARDGSGTPASSAGAFGPKSPTLDDAPGTSAQTDVPKPPADGPTLEEGDRLFGAGKYSDAGRCYAALARQNRLPPHRKQHWAYCRMVEVARKINLRPRTAREWDEIEAEIVSVQRLSPNIWYGEYLRNKVAEVRKKGRRPLAKSDNLVVRGTAPDENQGQPQPRRRLFGNSRGDSAAANAQPPATSPAASPEVLLNLPGDSSPPATPAPVDSGRANNPDPADNGGVTALPAAQEGAVTSARDNLTSGEWQVYETVNFRIYHRDARLAEAAGQAAEAVRAAQTKRWASPSGQKPWAPACDIYLYPTGKEFARETKQPEESPGFSTMESNGNRVVGRRVNLRADHPQVVAAILPHEVTHVVLADLFTGQQIPRWADEGMAVLAEPRAEQQVRAAELEEPLQSGRVFDLSKLMAMDYPAAKDWSLYYAQSVSLTRFLVEQAPPEQFIQFVQISQRDGIESALRGTYRIAGLVELQQRWTEYARQQVRPVREASRDPSAQPAEIGVK